MFKKKLCIDCVYHAPPTKSNLNVAEWSVCKYYNINNIKVSLVTGETYSKEEERFRYADLEREDIFGCGPWGRHFKKKL